METAEKPNYVLKANEGVLVPKNENLVPIKKAVWIIVGLIILGSFIFQDHLFSELTWSARIMLIVLAILVSFAGGTKMVPQPFEIWFFDDYLIVYREKNYYSKKLIRKEYNKFFYKDISKCIYRTTSEKFTIFGILEFICGLTITKMVVYLKNQLFIEKVRVYVGFTLLRHRKLILWPKLKSILQ